MAVPYTFGTATASIPLSQLDSNFTTTITLGNTAIQLGNTVTTLNNMTLANVTVSSGNVTFTNVSATTANVTIANITTAVIGTATITTAGITTANVATANITTEVVGTSTITTAAITTANVTTANVSTALSYSGTLTGGTGIVNLGSGQFYKDSSGNVGMGQTSITRAFTNYNQLNISGSSGATIQMQVGSTTNANIVSDGNALYLAALTGTMQFGVGGTGTGTERMRISTSGNLLKGTTTDRGYPLTVAQDASTGMATEISNLNSGANTTKTAGLLFSGFDGTAAYKAVGNITIGPSTQDWTASYMAFSTRIANVVAERMRIDTSGNVGIGTTSPNASAILDAQSTTKGVRMPNMTTTQKNAISSPAAGLMVFDTTLAKLCVYSGSAWQTITSV